MPKENDNIQSVPTSWQGVKHFRPSEFDSPDDPGSGINMDFGYMIKLDKLRERLGTAIVVTSGIRTEQHNISVGGVDESSHTVGMAADIACTNGLLRRKIIALALNVGIDFMQICIYPAHIHLGNDYGKPLFLSWGNYGNG